MSVLDGDMHIRSVLFPCRVIKAIKGRDLNHLHLLQTKPGLTDPEAADCFLSTRLGRALAMHSN